MVLNVNDKVNYRVKNSLQLVLSMLSLQSSEFVDPQARQLFTQAIFRITAIASVHELSRGANEQLKLVVADNGTGIMDTPQTPAERTPTGCRPRTCRFCRLDGGGWAELGCGGTRVAGEGEALCPPKQRHSVVMHAYPPQISAGSSQPFSLQYG
jgi:hypothetical protein